MKFYQKFTSCPERAKLSNYFTKAKYSFCSRVSFSISVLATLVRVSIFLVITSLAFFMPSTINLLISLSISKAIFQPYNRQVKQPILIQIRNESGDACLRSEVLKYNLRPGLGR